MENVWHEAKVAIKQCIPDHSYNMWIEPLELCEFKSGTVVLSCPNVFSKKRVQTIYSSIIESEMEKTLGSTCKLILQVNGKGKKSNKHLSGKELCQDPQMALPNMNIQQHTGRFLRNDFTFDNFVVGGSNDFAYSAALSLASSKNSAQNCLLMLSKTGMGKTHLSQAMGHHILSQYPTEKVYYITAEDFTNEMSFAVKDNALDKFKEKYRNKCDVFLLEDIHFLTGKERTQNELAFALDYMLEAKKKIIFTSCYLPTDIPKMSDQLKSRLSYGLISHIDAPDFRTRVRILRKKSKEKEYTIPDDIINYLASELSDNVRQLESGLIGVATKSSLLGVPIDLNLAESVVKNIVRQSKNITIDTIKKMVCKQYGISANDIDSRSRKQAVVIPRQVAMYLSRRYTDQPLQTIGKNFNRYHATVMHSISAIEKGLKKNSTIKKQVSFICEKLDTFKY